MAEKFQFGKFRIFLSLRFSREINFEDSRSAKSAISIHVEALNFNFWHISALKNWQKINIKSLKMC